MPAKKLRRQGQKRKCLECGTEFTFRDKGGDIHTKYCSTICSRKQSKGGGRPTLMTSEVIQKLEQAYALGCSDSEACFYANISNQTLYNYQKKKPSFVERKESLKQKPVLEARQTLVKGIKTNPDLALKYLERKLKDEFSLRRENTGRDGADLFPKTTINLNE